MTTTTLSSKKALCAAVAVSAALAAGLATGGGAESSAAPLLEPADTTFSNLSSTTQAVPAALRPRVTSRLQTLVPSQSQLVAKESTYDAYAVATKTPGVACLVALGFDGSSTMTCPQVPGQAPTLIGYGSAIGLVPDSVKRVTFTMSDGSFQTRAIAANVWRAPTEALLAKYDLGGQQQTVELMPLSSKPADLPTLPTDG